MVLFRNEKGKFQDVWSKKEYDSKVSAIEDRFKGIDNIFSKEYNNPPAMITLQQIYERSVNEGWISPLCGFDNYLKSFIELTVKYLEEKRIME